MKEGLSGPGHGNASAAHSPLVGPVLCLPLQESSSAWASQEQGLPSGLWPGILILLQGNESSTPYKWQEGNAVRKKPNFIAQQLICHSACVCVCVRARMHTHARVSLFTLLQPAVGGPPPTHCWGVTPSETHLSYEVTKPLVCWPLGMMVMFLSTQHWELLLFSC